METDKGGLRVEFAGPECAEIGNRGALEALLTVDGGVDFASEKTKPSRFQSYSKPFNSLN
jgi:hypothetical protein